MAAPHNREIVMRDGLVDPTALFEFMDGCHCEDLPIGAKPAGSHKEEGHHLIFTNKLVKKQKSRTLTSYRNSNNNILNMLECQEDLFHQLSAEQIPIEEIDLEAAQVFIEEADALTSLAAASYGKSQLEARLAFAERQPQSEVDRLRGRHDIISAILDREVTRVKRIQLTDESVVVGALLNYVIQQHEPVLERLVKERMKSGIRIHSPLIYETRALENMADIRINQKIKASNWTLRKLLQPEVKAA
jgi:hypothetical protein